MKSMFRKKHSIYEYHYKIETDVLGNDIVYHRGMDNSTFKNMRNDFVRMQRGRWFSGSHSNTYKMMLITLFGDVNAKQRSA